MKQYAVRHLKSINEYKNALRTYAFGKPKMFSCQGGSASNKIVLTIQGIQRCFYAGECYIRKYLVKIKKSAKENKANDFLSCRCI